MLSSRQWYVRLGKSSTWLVEYHQLHSNLVEAFVVQAAWIESYSREVSTGGPGRGIAEGTGRYIMKQDREGIRKLRELSELVVVVLISPAPLSDSEEGQNLALLIPSPPCFLCKPVPQLIDPTD